MSRRSGRDQEKTLRAPPSYVVYAADDLARASWYGLTAAQRGLLESMCRAYWVDRQLPSEPRLLALVCRLDAGECARLLTDQVLAHFEKDAEGCLHHVELRRQLQNIAVTREKQSEGGKKGVSIREQKKVTARKPSDGADSRGSKVDHEAHPSVDHKVREMKELKELNSTSSLGKREEHSVLPEQRKWVEEYDLEEARRQALGHGHA